MILHSLTHYGTHAFPKDEIAIDFDALPGLVGVHGLNGAGKTTLFDIITAGLYLVMPYRPGALHRNFVEAGWVELGWESAGQRYRSVVKVDPDAERSEATLFEVDDLGHERALAGPLVREYKAAVVRILGPIETFLASGYAVQNGAGAVLRMARPERKALLGDMLGLQVFPTYEATAKQRAGTLERELDVIRRRVTDLEARVAGRAALTAKDAELRGRLDTMRWRIDELQTSAVAAQATLDEARQRRAAMDPLKTELAGVDRELRELAQRLQDAETRRTNNEQLRGRAGEVQAAVTRELEVRGQLEALDGRLTAATATYQLALHAASTATFQRQAAITRVRAARETKERLSRQISILATVPCHGEGEYAGCQFLKDGAAASDGLPAATADVDVSEAALAAMPEPATPADPTSALKTEKTTLQTELRSLAITTVAAAQINAAEARIAELTTQIEQLARDLTVKQTRRGDLQAQLEQLPIVDEQAITAQRTVNDVERQRRDAQQDVIVLERELGQLDSQLTAVLAADVELDDVRGRAAPLARDLADWTLLAKAFGASGIPALLIDQALPEIGRLATELLRECYGESVFTIALTTQKENAAGDRLLETLDVIVSRGTEPIEAGLLSGGEGVLVSEALSLALALYNATRSGKRIHTLLRDEVSAPLDVERAPAYARMLRRAAQLGGFTHVLFVSHQPVCLELADARLHVAGGQVTVE